MKNKVLIITYYWPPYSSPGVQRWVKFVKYFNKFNIQPYVYTPQILSIDQSDDSLILDIPKNVDVIKKPIFLFDKILKVFLQNIMQITARGLFPPKKSSQLLIRYYFILEVIFLYLIQNCFGQKALSII